MVKVFKYVRDGGQWMCTLCKKEKIESRYVEIPLATGLGRTKQAAFKDLQQYIGEIE